MAANIFTGATNSNWGTATNWSLGTVPTPIDTHTATFNATSPNCTVNSVNRSCNNIDFTGYTNTITMTFSITVSGNVTLVSTMASRVSGTSGLIINSASTITSNGGTWNNSLSFGGSSNYFITLADDLNVLGSLTTINNAGVGFNGTFNINVTGGISIANGGVLGGYIGTGTPTLNILGGTISTTGTGVIRINTNIKANCTISGVFNYNTGILTRLSGIVTTTGSTLTIGANTTLINFHKVNFSNITVTAGVTLTMNEFFCGKYEVKTKVRSTGGNYNIAFTNTVQKKAFNINVKNCTVQRNQLNIINRDGNGGNNSGILFGENGMNGFPLNMFPSELSYPTANGLLTNMNN